MMTYLKMLPVLVLVIQSLVMMEINSRLDRANAALAKSHTEIAQLSIGIKMQNDTIDDLFKETQRQQKLLVQRGVIAKNQLAAAQKQSNVIMHARVPNQCCKALGWGAIEGPKLFP